MARRSPPVPEIEPKIFTSVNEIDRTITKLQRRINEIEQIDFQAAVLRHSGADEAAESNLQNTILEIYGPHSPEYREHRNIRIWASEIGVLGANFGYGGDEPDENQYRIEAKTNGRTQTIGIINGLITRLREKRADLQSGDIPAPSSYFENLNLHRRIADVTRDLFLDGHHFEAVFAGAKALVNFVKERSGRHDLDGAPLMRTVFSRNSPVLSFNDPCLSG
jgi:uncharacterized protein Ymh